MDGLRRRICNEKGFTLVELIVTMVIMVMIIQVVVTFNVVWARSWKKGSFQNAVQSNVALCMDTVIKDLRQAAVFEIVDGGTKVIYDNLNNDSMSLYFYSTDNELRQDLRPNGSMTTTTRTVARGINSVSFTSDQPDSIVVTIASVDKNGEDYTLTGNIKLRNID